MSELFSTVLSVDQLAQMIHKSPASIRSDASRNPTALPPICRLPGNKRLLWRLEDVQKWLAKYVQDKSHPATKMSEAITPEVKKRGRPRNIELGGLV